MGGGGGNGTYGMGGGPAPPQHPWNTSLPCLTNQSTHPLLPISVVGKHLTSIASQIMHSDRFLIYRNTIEVVAMIDWQAGFHNLSQPRPDSISSGCGDQVQHCCRRKREQHLVWGGAGKLQTALAGRAAARDRAVAAERAAQPGWRRHRRRGTGTQLQLRAARWQA
jgi:hypothetical protein